MRITCELDTFSFELGLKYPDSFIHATEQLSDSNNSYHQ